MRRPLAGLLLACVSCCPVGCAPDRQPPLRIGINVWPGYEFIHVAHELGLYEQSGLDVQVLEFGSLADVRRAFERRQIDAFAATLIEVVTAAQIGDRVPLVVYVTDYSDGADVIQARDITTTAQLAGKRIGLEPSTLSTFVLARALARSQLTLADVVLVPTAQETLARAMADGEIDAAVTYYPESERIAALPGVNTVFTSREVPGEILDVLAVDAELFAKRPGQVARFLQGFVAAQDGYRREPASYLPIMARREGVSAQNLQRTLAEEIALVDLDHQELYFEGGRLRSNLAEVRDVLVQVGILDAAADVMQVIGPAPATLLGRLP